MRLVDADALPVNVWLDGDGNKQQAIKRTDLATAPTVCCEQCAHWWREVKPLTGQSPVAEQTGFGLEQERGRPRLLAAPSSKNLPHG